MKTKWFFLQVHYGCTMLTDRQTFFHRNSNRLLKISSNLLVVYPHEVHVYDFFAPPLDGGVVTTVTWESPSLCLPEVKITWVWWAVGTGFDCAEDADCVWTWTIEDWWAGAGLRWTFNIHLAFKIQAVYVVIPVVEIYVEIANLPEKCQLALSVGLVFHEFSCCATLTDFWMAKLRRI